MSLMREELENRRWGQLKILRRILQQKPIPERYFTITSIDETPVEAENSFQGVLALIIRHADLIQGTPDEDKRALIAELEDVIQMSRDWEGWHKAEAWALREKGEYIERIRASLQ
jgi:hypothetical protein